MNGSTRSRLLTALCSGAVLLAQERPSAPAALALIVAIDEYAQPAPGKGRVPRLRGAENDAIRVEALLHDRFGFADEDVELLLGRDATHAAIVRTFHEHLIRRAGPDTKVVIWFSGHGSRVPDKSGADTAPRDRFDQPFDNTILAYDSRAGNRRGDFDITDDELHSLLAALPADHVVLVTDCCHSGGLLRGDPEGGVRHASHGNDPLSADAIAAFWPADVELLDDDDDRQENDSTVHIAACGAMQEAGEYSDDGTWHGTLTWFLTSVLATADRQTSWQALTETVRTRIAACRDSTRPFQLVECNGNTDRAIFGGIGRKLPDGFPTRPLPSGKLRIEAGRIQGIVEGTELQLIGLDGAAHGVVQVDRSRTTFSEARLVGGGELPTVAVRALPSKGLDGRAALRILCGSGVDPELLQGCPWAAKASGRGAADYLLVRRGDELELQTLAGLFVRACDREDLHRELFREHCFRSLWEGVARPGGHKVELGVRAYRGDQAAAAKLRASGPQRALVGAPYLPEHAGGERVEITVTNRSDQPLYIAVLSVAEDRAVNVIWGRDADNQLGAGATRPLPIEVGPSAKWPHERPMIDRYIAIATTSYADFTAFESAAEVTRGADAPDGLPTFLAGAIGGSATRGGGSKAPQWGIHWLDLELVLPDHFDELTNKRR